MEAQVKDLDSNLHRIYTGKIQDHKIKPANWDTKIRNNKKRSLFQVAELNVRDLVVRCLAEFLGIAILVFIFCMGCVKNMTQSKEPIPNLQFSFLAGFSFLMVFLIVGHISEAHINPLVSIVAFMNGKLTLVQLFAYFVAQFSGAFLGFGLLTIVTPPEYIKEDSSKAGVCSPQFHPELTLAQVFLVEFLICFILGLTCCGTWDPRNANKTEGASMRFAFIFTGLIVSAEPYSGANMNPARSFAPALINGYWKGHWIYWVAPISAAVLSSLLYKLVFADKKNNNGEQREGIIFKN